MAFPFVFEENFERGTKGNFNTETDTVAQLDFPSYKELARFPYRDYIPYAGAFVARWSLTGGTADAILIAADMNIAADVENFISMPIYFSPDFTATADDTVHLLELKAGATVEATFGFRIVAATGVINLGIGELAPTSFSTIEIERGFWYTVELRVDVDDGVGDDGSIGLFITKLGDPAGSETVTVATLDQGAITDGVLGVQNQLATTTGNILVDYLVQDDGRLFPLDRFPQTVEITESRHVFVGRGDIMSCALLSAAASNSLKLYDTDDGIPTAGNFVIELTVGAQTSNDDVLSFVKGCYAEVSGGTDPKGQVILPHQSNNYSGAIGPSYYSSANLKTLGRDS